MTTQSSTSAPAQLKGRITLEIAVRLRESGQIWTPEYTDPNSKPDNPLKTLLPIALHGDSELVARYPGDTAWSPLTLR